MPPSHRNNQGRDFDTKRNQCLGIKLRDLKPPIKSLSSLTVLWVGIPRGHSGSGLSLLYYVWRGASGK